MLELIAIALLQISSLTAPDITPVSGDTSTDTTTITTPPADSGHGGWGGGVN